MVGPFIFWDHMGPVAIKTGKELNVRSHPHIGLSTLTYLFEGAIMHRDSIGSEVEIRPGEVNWMTAGSGIVHSERSIKDSTAGSTLHGIQLWVALPRAHEETQPSFHHFDSTHLRSVVRDGVSYSLVAGSALGSASPVPVFSPLFYLHARHVPKGHQFAMPLTDQEEGAIYVVDGLCVADAGDHKVVPVEPIHMFVFTQGASVRFTAAQDSQVMVLGGAVFPEPRNVWWNFVSSSKDRIETAKKDWSAGRFASVVNEAQDDFIPLPK